MMRPLRRIRLSARWSCMRIRWIVRRVERISVVDSGEVTMRCKEMYHRPEKDQNFKRPRLWIRRANFLKSHVVYLQDDRGHYWCALLFLVLISLHEEKCV